MRRALVIGLDDYGAGLAPLQAASADADRVAALLGTSGKTGRNDMDTIRGHCPEDTARLGIRTQPGHLSGTTLLELIGWLVDARNATEGDFAVLYFAGHAVEDDGGALVCNGGLNDVVPMSRIVDAIMPSRMKVLVLLDTCTSGSFTRALDGTVALRDGVAVLAASRPGQRSAEYLSGGVFTTLLCEALEGAAADVLGAVTVPSIYAYISEALNSWDQRPVLRASISELEVVRECDPWVEEKVLSEVFRLFPHPEKVFPLDESYESDERFGGPGDPENMRVMGLLQKCRAARLVEPVDTDHMFYAAVNRTGCRLTMLGKRYWKQFMRDK